MSDTAADTEDVEVCPHCDRTTVRPRSHKPTGEPKNGDPEDDYYCFNCDRSFDDLDTRQRNGHSNVGQRQRLCDLVARADPDELGGGA